MAVAINTLISYVPFHITDRLAVDPGASVVPMQEQTNAAVLFADISGFTPLTEQLAERGPAGAESLSQILSDYFGILIDIITEHGGDPVKFAGDALLAIWPTQSEQLSTTALQVAQCALVAQKKLADYSTPDGRRLQLTISVGTGPVRALQIGGLYDRWEMLFSGSTLNEISIAEDIAQPGEVILTADAWQRVRQKCDGERLPSGYARLQSVLLPPETPPRRRRHPLSPDTMPAMRAHIPGAILSRIDAGQSGWLAELRYITVLFINLPQLNEETSLVDAQQSIRSLQKTLYHYEGSLNKISVDDKGVMFVAAFGLHPMAHEDDPQRGVRMALDLYQQAIESDWPVSIGVTTGRAFCGSIGNRTRREYTMLGNIVNLAARLMTAAADTTDGRPTILCDQPTYEAAADVINFETLEPIPVKGRRKTIPVFRPLGDKQMTLDQLPTGDTAAETNRAQVQILGRQDELNQLTVHLLELDNGRSGTVIVEGEAGMGKSQLVKAFKEQASYLGFGVFHSMANPVEQTASYHAWRTVFSQMFDLSILHVQQDIEMQRRYVLDLLEENPEILRLVPLLNAVLPLEFPENDTTAEMDGQVRADNTRDLLVMLLSESTRRSPKVIILEDVHWLDSASWALSLEVARQVPQLLLVMIARPIDPQQTAVNAIYRRLQSLAAETIYLTLLTRTKTMNMVKHWLNVEKLPHRLADYIWHKAEGHPFFSEELTHALLDAGIIVLQDGRAELTTDATDLRQVDFPDTVRGIVISRIDRLTPQEQLALKVASVIGRSFGYQLLTEIYPVDEDKPDLPDYMDRLCQLDIITIDTPDPDLRYSFKHAISHEVTYSLMSYAQRRELHRSVAVWYEKNYPSDLSPFYSLLAHHWQHADLSDKALSYLEKAAEEALRNGVYEEAHTFLEQLLHLSRARPSATDNLRAARRRRQLGMAKYGLGKPAQAKVHLEQTMEILGSSLPQSPRGWAWLILRESGRQIIHRLFPRRYIGRSSGKERLMELFLTGELLSQLYYFENERRPLLGIALQSINHTERLGSGPELAAAYAGMCVIVGAIPLTRLAEMYDRLAQETRKELNYSSKMVDSFVRTSLYHLGLSNWKRMQADLMPAVAVAREFDNRRGLAESLTLLAEGLYQQGNFTAARERYTDAGRVARQLKNRSQEMWTIIGRCQIMMRHGEVDEAVEQMRTAHDILRQTPDLVQAVRLHGLSAVAALYQNDHARALEHARAAADSLRETNAYSPFLLEGVSGMAYTFLTLWQTDHHGEEGMRHHARWACRQLSRLTRPFPIAQPRTHNMWAWFHWLDGREDKAAAVWQKAITAADKQEMPYEHGLALFLHGRLRKRSTEQYKQLSEAMEIFAQLGARQDEMLARKAR